MGTISEANERRSQIRMEGGSCASKYFFDQWWKFVRRRGGGGRVWELGVWTDFIEIGLCVTERIEMQQFEVNKKGA